MTIICKIPQHLMLRSFSFQLKEKIFNPNTEDGVPHCEKAECRGVVRPDVVLFGESLPECKS